MAEVQKEVFPNGLKLVTEAMPAVRSVSVGIWLRVGSRNEREVENGITHFLEHMVFKGTKHRSAEDIARAADSIGGHLDAFTAKEFTSFSIKALDEHVPRAFEILSDLVKNPLVLRADERIFDEVGEDFESAGHVLVERLDGKAGELLGGEGVEMPADGVRRTGDILGRAVLCPFENHVLQEMRDAVLDLPLVPRADPQPNADGYGTHGGHRLGDQLEAVRKNLFLNFRHDCCPSTEEPGSVLIRAVEAPLRAANAGPALAGPPLR